MPGNDQTPSQFRPTGSLSLFDEEIRKVLRCPHCDLVQFLPKNAMCRRCHKAFVLEETERPCVSPDRPQPPNGNPRRTGARRKSEAGIAAEIGIRVRKARQMRGLSQGKVAARMNVLRTYVSKVENCKAVPTLRSLSRITGALLVEVHHLLSDSWLEQCD